MAEWSKAPRSRQSKSPVKCNAVGSPAQVRTLLVSVRWVPGRVGRCVPANPACRRNRQKICWRMRMEANLELTVVRYEVYPRDNPSSFCIGFSIRHAHNNKTMYKDCLVPLSDNPSEDVLNEAWLAIKPCVEAWYDTVKDMALVVGSVFVPPAPADAADAPPAEALPVDAADALPVDAADAPLAEALPADALPVDAADAPLAEALPADAPLAEALPADAPPAEALPADAPLADAPPADD